MWKISFRVAACLFAGSIFIYTWIFWDRLDWLALFAISLGCLLFMLIPMLNWPAILFSFCVLCISIWTQLYSAYRMQQFEEQQLWPYSKEVCSSCQALLQQDARYCMRCGSPAKNHYCVKWCPACHHRMPIDATFCPQCRYGMQPIVAAVSPEKKQPTSRRQAIQIERFRTQTMPVVQKPEASETWIRLAELARSGPLQTFP